MVMIQVDVITNDDGAMNVQVVGHASKEVCASVSTLMQSSIRYMQELAKQYPDQIEVNVQEVEL